MDDKTRHRKKSKSHELSQSIPDLKHTIFTTNFDCLTDIESEALIKEIQEKYNKISYTKWLGIAPSILILVFFLFFSFDIIDRQVQYGKFVKVNYPIVNIREANSQNSRIMCKAELNEEFFYMEETDNNWCKIQLNSNEIGFVHSSLISYTNRIIKKQNIRKIESNPLLVLLLFSLTSILLLAWNYYLSNLDEKRKKIILTYNFDDALKELHNKFLQSFQEFSNAKIKWQILHKESTADKKYSAGATTALHRKPINRIKSNLSPFKYLYTNVKIPCAILENIEFYFFPEMLILKRDDKFASIFYKNLVIERYSSSFREYDYVPSDAKVIEYTWKFVNKNSGTDLRFKNNQKFLFATIPVIDSFHMKESTNRS